MKYKLVILFLIAFSFAAWIIDTPVPIQQVGLNANNINAWFCNSGIFDQDLRTSNTPGFEWPKGSGKMAVFTAGMSCAGYIQNTMRQFICSYKGELAPGYIIDSAGSPKAKTDYRFKIYNVKRTDNHINNPDWLNWGAMVPYGAPFIDVNHNNSYDPLTDTPGVKGAAQTIFACLTDGFPEEHTLSEGFGGGTLPMFAEVHFTGWAYDKPGLQDVQYLKWVIINNNKYSWDSTYFSIITDPDIGNVDDDFAGCDTIRRMGFCYNGDNDDEQGSNTYNYGINPPAVGFKFIKTAKIGNAFLGMTSCIPFHTHLAYCEFSPRYNPEGAYYMMQGLKMDRTPWMIPPGGNPSLKTKYVYTGDPETGQGWNIYYPATITGSVLNCGGPDSLTGEFVSYVWGSDRKMLLSTGSSNLKVNPGDTQIIVAAQLIARGSNNLNSVTKLKQLSDIAQTYYDSGFVISVNNISSEIPQQYKLYQNYPNPFNPTTKIRFEIPLSRGVDPDGAIADIGRRGVSVKLTVFDILGKEITMLINQQLQPGTYEVDWNASDYPSGVYFYRIQVNNYSETRKMILLK